MNAFEPNASAPTPAARVTRAIFLGGLVVGVLDAIDGVVWFGLTSGFGPLKVLKYIASGALGPAAFSGGIAAAALGALIHFGLAWTFTALFVLLWTASATLRRHPFFSGLSWGAAVWALMNLAVLPLTRVPPSRITAAAALHGIVGHALFVGLSAALVAAQVIGRDRAREGVGQRGFTQAA